MIELRKFLSKTLILKDSRTKKPSFFSSFFLSFIPPAAEKPPNLPSDLITGKVLLGEYGFFPQAFATARADFRIFIPIATSL